MRKSRVLAAALAAAMCVSVVTLTSAAPAGAGVESQDIPRACPSDTASTTFLGGDDFEPAGSADPDDKIHLDWNIAEDGAFQIIESTTRPGYHYLKGRNPVEPGITSVETTSPVGLPSGKTSVLSFPTRTDLDEGTKATVDVGIAGTWHRIGEFPTQYPTTRAQFSLGPYAGQKVLVRFSIDATATTFSGSGTGWNINDVFFYSCDPATLPRAPYYIDANGQSNGDVMLSWQTGDDSDPTNDATAYQVVVRPGGEVRTVGATAGTNYSWFSGLDTSTKYTFEVRGVNKAGTGPAAESDLAPTRITSSQSAKTIVYGSAVTVSGKLSRSDDGSGLASQDVELRYWRKGSPNSWKSAGTAHTAADGAYSYAWKPTASYEFNVSFVPFFGDYWPSETSVRSVAVRQRVSGAWADSTIRRGTTAKFSGSVAPNHAGKTIYLQRHRADGSWYTERSTSLSSSSTYTFSRSFSTAKSYYYRTYIRADAYHASGWSTTRKITVS